MDRLEELTRTLVAVPTADAEARTASLIASWLRDQTAAEIEETDAGNVIARKGAGDPALALVGHHDVVEPDPEQVENGKLRVHTEGDRLYGRGTADMKGALAAMLLAFREAEPERELIFASFAGEERGGIGAQAAIDAGFRPAYAIVGEGSAAYTAEGRLDVAVGHKGRRGSTITVSGRSAHASQPEEGVNAIYRAAEIVQRIRELEAPETSIAGGVESGSVAVTEIQGGTAWNVIPDTCTVTVDERTVPGERADLARLAEAEGVDRTVDQDLPPMACDDEAFLDRLHRAVADAQPDSPAHVVKPHATDAGWLAAAGTTCLVCGPAEPGEAHSANESVSLPLLKRASRSYHAVADGWAGIP
ncbi:MAG: M20 family metallopeptidase [Halodesulfurarchaeum sp.]